MSISIRGTNISKIHFIGIFGSGMSALAQFLAWQGIAVSGSDRSFNKPETDSLQKKLEDTGCTLFHQDGSFFHSSQPDALCISTAIEDDNPDLAAAREKKIPVLHRSDILSEIVKQHKTIAVAGTSGKSTVTAMIFEFLTACGKAPSLITGAPLKRLERQDYIGNAFYGLSDILVIEADESDGSLIKYTPYLSVILNVSKDHKPVDEIVELFRQLARNSTVSIGNADDSYLPDLDLTSYFSLDSKKSLFRPDEYSLSNRGGTVKFGSSEVYLPLPGKHNLQNCTAALAVCEHMNCRRDQLYEAVNTFDGVSRRFAVTRTGSGVTVIDDFAHNPEKIKAAISASRTIASQLTVIYQPHGFGPTNFLRKEYQEAFMTSLIPDDRLILLPIYYAGGTANKNISSEDLKNDLAGVPFSVNVPENREDIIPQLKKTVSADGCILVMGARDQSLPLFVKDIIETFQ